MNKKFLLSFDFFIFQSDESLMAVWNCQWNQKNLNFQKYILFVMMFSKSKISFKAGGIVEVDRNTFINVS